MRISAELRDHEAAGSLAEELPTGAGSRTAAPA